MNDRRRSCVPRSVRRLSSTLCALSMLTLAHVAGATYSVVGVDTVRREVGGTGTSCLGGQDVYIIYGSVPGVGVVHAQASLNLDARDRAVTLLTQGIAPADIIQALTDASFDRQSSLRQYAVADVTGRVAGFTGSGTGTFAGDQQGAPAHFVYSVQGNILTGQRVLTQAASAFEANGCDLAERLMLALEAGADGGEGDSRCTDDGIPSDSAFLQVDREGEAAGSYVSLRVQSSGEANPLPLLRELFSAWRATHPCPTPLADAGPDADARPETDAGPDTDAGPETDAGPDKAPPAKDEASCGCRTHVRSPATAPAVMLLFLAAASRRRRSPRARISAASRSRADRD